MSRSTEGKRFSNSLQYNKLHIFEDIQELYKLACLEYGYHPMKFIKEPLKEDGYKTDYALCEQILIEAKRIRDAGGGHIKLSTVGDDKEARKANGYSYRVYTVHDRAGYTDSGSGSDISSSDPYCCCN